MAKASEKTVGSFVVEREIAEGGMGVVMLARQTSLDRPAILKRIRRELTNRPEVTKRFQREARAAAAIHHQNVVAVYDCFTHRSDHYIAQEYVDGVDLCTVLEKKGAVPWRIAAIIALEALRGLEEIHARGTVHRDLKPSNILLGRRGEVKIADFGIALESTGSALTAPGMMIGTPPYTPPEQLLGERLDARGDLYSFGVVLYTMLAGELPFAEPSEDQPKTLLQLMQKERYPAIARSRRVPAFLSRIVKSCLRAKRRRRASSARELRLRLETKLGAPSPADCHAVLAHWLWESQLFEPNDNETFVRVTPSLPRRSGFASRLVVAALVIAGALSGVFASGIVTRRELEKIPYMLQNPEEFMPKELSNASSFWKLIDARKRPARLSVAADEGVALEIDGEAVPVPSGDEALELAPGEHELIFYHPERGSARQEIDLAPGEELEVTPVFGDGGK